jgi:hypothetical protein
MSSGFVKARRGIIDHVRDGNLNANEFAVFQLLVLMADSSTGSHTINSAVLRSSYFPEMTRDTAQRILVSLEQKGFIFRLNPASHKRAYRYWINKYEATTGPNRLRRTDLSQVFESKSISDLRWVDAATDTQTDIQTETQTEIPTSYQEIKKEEVSSPLRSTTSGRENGALLKDQPVTHVGSSSPTNEVAIPEEVFSLTGSSLVPPPCSAAATPRRAKTTKKTKAADPRTREFRIALECDWAQNNPEVSLPWDGGEAAALKTVLSDGKLKLEFFKLCLTNRSRSQNANLGDRPRKFLPNITSYSRGPLDAYGHLKSQAGPVNTSSAGRPSDIVRESTEYLEKKRRAIEEEQAQIESGRQVAHA